MRLILLQYLMLKTRQFVSGWKLIMFMKKNLYFFEGAPWISSLWKILLEIKFFLRLFFSLLPSLYLYDDEFRCEWRQKLITCRFTHYMISYCILNHLLTWSHIKYPFYVPFIYWFHSSYPFNESNSFGFFFSNRFWLSPNLQFTEKH